MSKDFYAILGLPRNATARQIRQTFLRLARERHPDHFGGPAKRRAEEDFQVITEAFNTLGDPEKRRQHDLELAQPEAAESEDLTFKVLLQRGIQAYRRGDYREAAQSFERATREKPDDARSWYHLARACRHEERWMGRARAAITKACELAAMDPSYFRFAGQVFAESGHHAKAKHYYRQALDWGGDREQIEAALERLRKAPGRGKGLFRGRPRE